MTASTPGWPEARFRHSLPFLNSPSQILDNLDVVLAGYLHSLPVDNTEVAAIVRDAPENDLSREAVARGWVAAYQPPEEQWL